MLECTGYLSKNTATCGLHLSTGFEQSLCTDVKTCWSPDAHHIPAALSPLEAVAAPVSPVQPLLSGLNPAATASGLCDESDAPHTHHARVATGMALESCVHPFFSPVAGSGSLAEPSLPASVNATLECSSEAKDLNPPTQIEAQPSSRPQPAGSPACKGGRLDHADDMQCSTSTETSLASLGAYVTHAAHLTCAISADEPTPERPAAQAMTRPNQSCCSQAANAQGSSCAAACIALCSWSQPTQALMGLDNHQATIPKCINMSAEPTAAQGADNSRKMLPAENVSDQSQVQHSAWSVHNSMQLSVQSV